MNFLFCIPRDLHFFSFADWVSVARNLACLRLETLMSDLVKVTQDESVCDSLNILRLCLDTDAVFEIKESSKDLIHSCLFHPYIYIYSTLQIFTASLQSLAVLRVPL